MIKEQIKDEWCHIVVVIAAKNSRQRVHISESMEDEHKPQQVIVAE